MDKLSAAYIALDGTSGSGYGAGDLSFGASLKAADVRALVEGSASALFADADIQSVLVSPSIGLAAAAKTDTLYATVFASFFNLLDTVAAKARTVSSTIVDFDSYLSWYNFRNASSYWQCPALPDWYYAYSACRNGTKPNHYNNVFEVLQGATYKGVTFTNALGKWVITGSGTGTLTLGPTIDPTIYAGGLAYVKWSGTPGANLVTVTGKDQDGATETWTVTIGAGATGSALLVPSTHAYSYITKVDTIGIASSTSGTLYIEAHSPRTNPPT